MSMIMNLNKGGGSSIDVSSKWLENTYNATNLNTTFCKISQDGKALNFRVNSTLKAPITDMQSTRRKICELPDITGITYPSECTIHITYPDTQITCMENKHEYYEEGGSKYVPLATFTNKKFRAMNYKWLGNNTYDMDGNKIDIAKTSKYVDLDKSHKPAIWYAYKADVGEDYQFISKYQVIEIKGTAYELGENSPSTITDKYSVDETGKQTYMGRVASTAHFYHDIVFSKWYIDGTVTYNISETDDIPTEIPAGKEAVWNSKNGILYVRIPEPKIVKTGGPYWLVEKRQLNFNANYMLYSYLQNIGCNVDEEGNVGHYECTNAYYDIDVVDASNDGIYVDGCYGTYEFIKDNMVGIKTECRATIEGTSVYVDGSIVLKNFEIEGMM